MNFYRSKQAFDHFERIGVKTVGQLASMSTLTANSIPAGDSRIRRLRRALEVVIFHTNTYLYTGANVFLH